MLPYTPSSFGHFSAPHTTWKPKYPFHSVIGSTKLMQSCTQVQKIHSAIIIPNQKVSRTKLRNKSIRIVFQSKCVRRLFFFFFCWNSSSIRFKASLIFFLYYRFGSKVFFLQNPWININQGNSHLILTDCQSSGIPIKKRIVSFLSADNNYQFNVCTHFGRAFFRYLPSLKSIEANTKYCVMEAGGVS